MGFVLQISNYIFTASGKIDSDVWTSFFETPAYQHPVIHIVVTHQHSKFLTHTSYLTVYYFRFNRMNWAIFCVG